MTASRWIPAVTLSIATALGLLAGWILETSAPSRGAGVTSHSHDERTVVVAGPVRRRASESDRQAAREPWVASPADGAAGDEPLEPGHRPMRGQVVQAEDGTPIAGARVTLEEDVRGCRWPGMNEPRRIALVTDLEGGFEARVTGSWDLTVNAPGRVTMSGTFVSGGCSLPVPPGLRFEMPRGRPVRGEVRDRDGDPVAALVLKVVYLGDAAGVRPRGRSAADGSFALGNVVLGVPFVVVGDLHGDVDARSLPVVVLADGESPFVRVTAPHLVSVSGVVRRPGSATLEDLLVQVTSREERYRPHDEWAWTDAWGRFELYGLEPGSYQVQVAADSDSPTLLQRTVDLPAVPSRQFWELELPEVSQAAASASEESSEDLSDSTGDDDASPDPEILRGRVTGSCGEQVAARVALLVVTPETEPDGSGLDYFDYVETDPAGSIELEAPLDAVGWILAVAPGHASGRMPLAAVREGAPLRLGPGRTVRGRVRTSRGAAVSSIPVRVRAAFLGDLHLWGGEEEFFPPSLTAADGSFHLEHVSLEECIVEVGSPEADWVVARRTVEAGAADVNLDAIVLID